MNQYMGEEKAIQIGYASWSPIIFLNFIKNNKFKKGTNFNIFIMTNDFLNDYYASNYAYHKILNKE